MGFGKAVFAKSFYLVEDLARKTVRVTPRFHAAQQFFFKRLQSALAVPCSHATPQLIRFPRAEPRSDHRQLHHLFLEDGNAQGALQHFFHCLAGIGDRLLAAPPS